MKRVDDFDDTPTIHLDVSERDLYQILTAMENRGDHINGDPRWSGLYLRLAQAAPWDEG